MHTNKSMVPVAVSFHHILIFPHHNENNVWYLTNRYRTYVVHISASDKYSGKAVIGQSVVGTHEPEGVHLLIRLREAAFIHISILLIYIVDMYTCLLYISIFTLCRYLSYP